MYTKGEKIVQVFNGDAKGVSRNDLSEVAGLVAQKKERMCSRLEQEFSRCIIFFLLAWISKSSLYNLSYNIVFI